MSLKNVSYSKRINWSFISVRAKTHWQSFQNFWNWIFQHFTFVKWCLSLQKSNLFFPKPQSFVQVKAKPLFPGIIHFTKVLWSGGSTSVCVWWKKSRKSNSTISSKIVSTGFIFIVYFIATRMARNPFTSIISKIRSDTKRLSTLWTATSLSYRKYTKFKTKSLTPLKKWNWEVLWVFCRWNPKKKTKALVFRTLGIPFGRNSQNFPLKSNSITTTSRKLSTKTSRRAKCS